MMLLGTHAHLAGPQGTGAAMWKAFFCQVSVQAMWVGPNRVTNRRPNADAKCLGPLSVVKQQIQSPHHRLGKPKGQGGMPGFGQGAHQGMISQLDQFAGGLGFGWPTNHNDPMPPPGQTGRDLGESFEGPKFGRPKRGSRMDTNDPVGLVEARLSSKPLRPGFVRLGGEKFIRLPGLPVPAAMAMSL